MKSAHIAMMGEKFGFGAGGGQFPVSREWFGVLLFTLRQKSGLLLHQKQISAPSWPCEHFSLFPKIACFS